MEQFAKEVGPLSLECHVLKGYYVRGETQTLPRVNFVHDDKKKKLKKIIIIRETLLKAL